MIGIWSKHVGTYLRIMGGVTLLTLGLPIFLLSTRWAEALQWEIPADMDLALYFARSLGAVACALSGAAFYVAGKPALQGAYIRLTIAIYALVGGAHVWGALEGSQPITETLEIGAWALLIALALAFLPSDEVENPSD